MCFVMVIEVRRVLSVMGDCGIVLSDAVVCDAVLSDAVLSDAVLSNAVLSDGNKRVWCVCFVAAMEVWRVPSVMGD